MKKSLFGNLLLSLLALLILGHSANAQKTFSEEQLEDKEAAYKVAVAAVASKKGCEAIPFSYATRCRTEYTRMKAHCDTKRSCTDLEKQLNTAIKDGNKTKMKEIRDACALRVGINRSCLDGRDRVQDFFRNAKKEVEDELEIFEDQAKTATGASKTRLTKLIEYAKKLIEHYVATENSHKDEIEKVELAELACEIEIRRANENIKK